MILGTLISCDKNQLEILEQSNTELQNSKHYNDINLDDTELYTPTTIFNIGPN